MALEEQINTEVLSTMKGVPYNPSTDVSTNDFNNFVPSDLSPDQQALFQQQQRMAPATGPLANTTYYPGVNTPINVGNYGGSEVGNLTLFAPGGDLVPIGMLDAREAAVKRAALEKMKEADDFRKKYQAPTTKHSSVQKELDKTYFSGLQQWVDNAKKKYGTNWHQALEQDVNFNKWNKAAQTAAQQEDYIVSNVARIEDDIKTGKFVSNPELSKAMADFKAGLHGLGKSPFNKEGHNLNEYWATLNAEHDFAQVANEQMKQIKMQQDASAGVDTSNPEYLKTLEVTTESYSPESFAAVSQNMKNFFPNMQPAEIEKRVKSMFDVTRVKKDVTASQKREPQGGQDYTYNNNDFSDEPSSINTKIKGQAGTDDREGNLVTTDGLTFKKPIKIQMPVGQRVHFTDEGLVPSQIVGNKDVDLGKMVIADVLNKPGSPLDGTPITKDQLKEGVLVDGKRVKIQPSMIRKESMVTGSYKEKDEAGTVTEKSFLVPTKEVENSLVKKWGKDGKVEIGVPVDESYKRAEKYNVEHVDKNVFPDKKTAANEVKRKTKDGKIAIFDEATKKFIRYE